MWIFIVTAFYHSFILKAADPRSYLGIVMVIPMVVLIVLHIIMRKKIDLQLFSLRRPVLWVLIIAMILPIVLGLLLHMYLKVENKGVFLFEQIDELFVSVAIGLTLASVSALVEEMVWRGYFHVQLRKSYSIYRTALIVACIWSVWHLPIAIFYKNYINAVIGILSYISILLFTSFALTMLREWSYSVFPSAVFHGLMNVFYFGDGIGMNIPVHSVELVKFVLLFMVGTVIFLGYRLKLPRKMKGESL